ncbi:hypothetical protein [Mycolicibacterium smegmatis]|uniref:hypothetical protein n=1 Tax=Mycolicibacterium smegmatis TaxID=1772 RepID=UPI001F2D0BFD|nr:hypothetical protein [Mycolicibacterium smegmatis]
MATPWVSRGRLAIRPVLDGALLGVPHAAAGTSSAPARDARSRVRREMIRRSVSGMRVSLRRPCVPMPNVR